jgi:hypothetical protein
MTNLTDRMRFNASTGIPDFTNSKLLNKAADRIEQLEAALRAVIVRCEEGDKKSDWLPTIANIARAALDQSSSTSCSGCAGITHTHTCGDPAKQPQLESSPRTASEMHEDTFKYLP